MYYGIIFFYIENNKFINYDETDKILFKDENNINCVLTSFENKKINESKMLKVMYGPFKEEEICIEKIRNVYLNLKYGLIKMGFGLRKENCNGGIKESKLYNGIQMENAYIGYKTIKILDSLDKLQFNYIEHLSEIGMRFEYNDILSHDIDDKLIMGFELINYSNLEYSTRVQFLNLITAIEVLKEEYKKSNNIINIIDRFQEINKLDVNLSEEEKEKVKNGLNNLKNESISFCCEKLIQDYIPDNNYCNMKANNFFRKCYKIRSNIIHGKKITGDSNTYLLELRRMVIDLYDSYIERKDE